MARYVLFANLTAQRFLSRMEKRISRPSSEGERAVQYGYWTNPDGTPVSKPQNCLFLTTDGLSFDLNRLKPRKNRLGRHLEPISVPTQTISVPSQAVSVAPQAISVASQTVSPGSQGASLPTQAVSVHPQVASPASQAVSPPAQAASVPSQPASVPRQAVAVPTQAFRVREHERKDAKAQRRKGD